jgi:hypothetical protein
LEYAIKPQINNNKNNLNHSNQVMANAQLQALQYVQSKLGRESLVVGGHRLRVKNKRNDRVYWRCSIPACPATVNTHEGHPVQFGLPHNHPANQPKIEVMKMM